VAVVVGLDPVLEPAVLRQLVEVRARDRDLHARVAGWVLRDLRAGDLDAPDGGVVAAGAELQPDHDLEVLQRRDLLAEPLDGLDDQRAGVARAHGAGGY
jgi:hypothetical protein